MMNVRHPLFLSVVLVLTHVLGTIPFAFEIEPFNIDSIMGPEQLAAEFGPAPPPAESSAPSRSPVVETRSRDF